MSKKNTTYLKHKEKGMEINQEHVRETGEKPSPTEPEYAHGLIIQIPWNKDLSKNSMINIRRDHRQQKTQVMTKKEHQKSREDIIWLIKSRINQTNAKFYENKVWLDIFVEKPTHQADAINVIDGLADAITKAIGIDDKWFSIYRLDWMINKENPKIWVTITQEEEENKQICSYCGRILDLEIFYKDKNNKLTGRNKICKDCLVN